MRNFHSNLWMYGKFDSTGNHECFLQELPQNDSISAVIFHVPRLLQQMLDVFAPYQVFSLKPPL